MSKKLFLADDSVTIQKVVELILAEEDFNVRVFSNGEDAWNAIKEERPDIVLADIEMPGMNGYQLCEKIKSDEQLKDIPVILLAGAFEPIDEELARDVKADDYIVKPFESNELISKINALLTEAQEYVEVQEDTAEEEVAEVAEAEAVSEEEPVETLEMAEETADEAISDVWDFEEEPPSVEELTEDRAETVTEEETVFEAPEQPAPEPQEMAAPQEAPVQQEPVSAEQPTVQQPEAALAGITEQGVQESINTILDDKFQKILDGIEVERLVSESLDRHLPPQIEKLLAEKVSPVVEESIKKVVEELASNFRKEIEKIIWETVPDLAETIITKEIEKIKSTF